jgi:Mitochondrial carrier protein
MTFVNAVVVVPPPTPRQKAMADASAGVVASLLALWFFYPLELSKLAAQTNTGPRASTTTSSSTIGGIRRESDVLRLDLANVVGTASLSSPLRRYHWILRIQALLPSLLNGLRTGRWFAGLRTKSLHTAASSFCYFYLYSWIVSSHRWRQRQRLQQLNPQSLASVAKALPPLSASTRLLLSAVAAMLNTLVTLPVDVLATQHQLLGSDMLPGDTLPILSRSSSADDGTEAYIFYDASSDEESSDVRFLSMDTNCMEEESDTPTDDENITSGKEADCGSSIIIDNTSAVRVEPPSIASRLSNRWAIYRRYPWLSLWKGLLPSLILCSNPAIHYTVYDVAKLHYLSVSQDGSDSAQHRRVTMVESFVLGLFAKLVATLATYPLIQAKVQIMTQVASSNRCKSLWSHLYQEYSRDGISGLYRGFQLQLLHTLLKSALLVMLRERIERTTRRLLLPPSPSKVER